MHGVVRALIGAVNGLRIALLGAKRVVEFG